MRHTVYNTAGNNACVAFPSVGEPLMVKLHGDDLWYSAVALDRPRKLWCSLEIDGRPFIADENSIEIWEYDEPLADPVLHVPAGADWREP